MTSLTGRRLAREKGRLVTWADVRPITFEEFAILTEGNGELELVNGVVVERDVTNLEHEKLFAWLMQVMGLYCSDSDAGLVLGSRTGIKINEYSGRLPDILFVRKDRQEIVQETAVYGPPDLVIEIISPSDRRAGLISRLTDYRSINIPEIVHIDLKRKEVQIFRLRDGTYLEWIVREGGFYLEAIDGLWLGARWLFSEPRPGVREAVEEIRSELPE